MSKRTINNAITSDKRRKIIQDPASSQSSQSSQSLKGLEKIISQNQKIIQKIDTLINSQKLLEEQIAKLEQVSSGCNKKELINVINLFT